MPAREGTLRVLRASLDAGVGRVVLTSSVAAIAGAARPGSGKLTEAGWTDPGKPGIPRIGFSFVDVRDVADLHLRAMTAPAAGGERFIAAGPFFWMSEVAAVLRDRLGETAAKVPKRNLPDLLVRAAGRFDPGIRSILNQLGVKYEYSSEKSESLLGWSPRPAEEMFVDCARSLAAA